MAKKPSKYTLFSEDQNCYLVHDGNAHFKIAKKGLTKEAEDKIKKLAKFQHFADGGQVANEKEDYDAISAKDKTDKANQIKQEAGEQMDGYSSKVNAAMSRARDMTPKRMAEGGDVELPPVPLSMQDPNTIGAVQPPDAGNAPFTMNAMSPSINPTAGLPDPKDDQSGLIAADTGLPPPAAQDASRAPASDSGMPTPDEPVLSQPGPAQAVQGPAGGQQPQAQSPIAGLAGGFEAGLSEKQKGIEAEAQAKSAMAQPLIQAAQDQAKAAKDAVESFQKTYAGYQKEGDHLFNEIQAGKIDPNRWFANQGTGGQIGAALAIIGGGLGGGISGRGGNVALDVIQKAIDRDIDAQKADLNNKNNLLSQNFARTKNLESAVELTRSQYATIAAAKAAEASATAMAPLAKAELHKASGDLLMDAAQKRASIAMTQMAAGLQGGSDDPHAISQKIGILEAMNDPRGKELRARYVPGVGLAQKEIPNDKMSEIVARNTLDKQLNDLKAYSAKYSGTLPTTPENIAIINRGRAMGAEAQNAIRQAMNGGVFKKSESEFINSMANVDPTLLFSKYRAIPGYQAVQDNNQLSLRELKRGYGLPLTTHSGATLQTPGQQSRGFVPSR